jgi:hypothetical protein
MIIIKRLVSVASAAIIRVSYKNTNNCTKWLNQNHPILKGIHFIIFRIFFLMEYLSVYIPPFLKGRKSFTSFESIWSLGKNTWKRNCKHVHIFMHFKIRRKINHFCVILKQQEYVEPGVSRYHYGTVSSLHSF